MPDSPDQKPPPGEPPPLPPRDPRLTKIVKRDDPTPQDAR